MIPCEFNHKGGGGCDEYAEETALSKNILIKLYSDHLILLLNCFIKKRDKMIEINNENCRKALGFNEDEYNEHQQRGHLSRSSNWKTVWDYLKNHYERKYGSLDGLLDLSTRGIKRTNFLQIERKINRVLSRKSTVEVIQFDTERETQPRRRSRQDDIDPNPAPFQARRSSRNSQGSTQRRSHSQTVEEELATMRARLAESESQREQLQLQLGNYNALANLFKERNRSGNRFEYGHTLQALSLELLAETVSATDMTKIYTVLGDVMGLVDSPDKHVPKENYFRQLRSKLDSALDEQTREFIESAEVGFQINVHHFNAI